MTRERILTAARKIFAEHPYKAASIRMIGKEGGFDHPLIHYYFPTKAELFEAVVSEICDDFCNANISWFEGIERSHPKQALPIYIDRFLEYHFEHPEVMRIIALNSAQIDKLDEIPGYQHIPEILAKARQTFEDNVRLRADAEQISMFIHSFNTLVISYLGASSCQAEVLGMDPQSDEYRAWVKNALLLVFGPLLEKLIFPDKTVKD